jgi:trimeric autotransporter adhesin
VSAHARHLCRTLAIALAVAAVALLAATLDASAYVTGHGTGSASASVTTLAAPTITRTSTGAASVTLTWSSVTAPASGSVAYYVRRDGGAASAACPSSASPSAVTSCTDTGVSTGSHSYTVTAVWRTWTRASASANATVAFGPATQLVFTTQPGGSPTGGTAFPTQPVVTARDASGNTVTDYSGVVDFAIVSGTGTAGAALSGCRGTLSNGVTTFSGCAIDKAGSNYRLRASDRTLSVDSAAFTVSVGAATRLVFTTQPGGGATGGLAFPTQPVVTAQDAGGNRVTSFTGTVTLSILSGTGTAGATLSGCSGATSNGVASFSNCQIDKAGTGYRLHASANSGALGGDSAAFDVSVGAVSQLAFTTQPGGGATGGLAFPTQPVVTAQDAGGNTVAGYTRPITLTIASNSGDKNAVLSGCTGTTTSGVATFSGCEIDLPGTDYRLRASDGATTVNSAQFAVSVGPAAEFVWTTSPGSSTAGTAFGNQPVVTAQDAGGNVVTTYAGTVALSIRSGPAGATLSGCTIARRSLGVTTFSGCKLDKSGTYVLVAGDGAATGDSSSFAVNPGTVSTIAFTTQPAGAAAGSVFTTQPVVTALDAFGNVATSYSGTVTLSIKSGTGAAGATLSGCGGSRSNGVVTFSGCKISTRGSNYQLRASDGTRTADSATFDVR